MQQRARFFIIGLSLLSALIGLWLAVNWQPVDVGVKISIVSIVALIVAVLEKPIISASDTDAPDDGDADIEPGRQIATGGILGTLIIILSIFTTLTMLLPSVSYSIGDSLFSGGFGRALIDILAAPLFEEAAFLYAIPFIIFIIILNRTDSLWIANIGTLILASVAFAVFHWLAYGGSSLTSGAFFGAMVFRFVTLGIVLAIGRFRGFTSATVAPVIISTIVMHVIFNTFVYGKAASIVGA